MKNKLIILTFFLVLNTGASFSQGILTRIGEKIPNVEADYYAGKKWLAFFHVDFVPGFSAGMTIWIDMDDYMGITEEGKQGWVTLWFDETFGIAPKPVAFGCLPREYDLNTPDSPTYFLNLEGNASIPGFTALSMGVSAGPDEIAHIDYIDFLEDFYYDVSASLSVHVISLEVQKGPLDILLAKSLVPGAKVSAVTNLIFNVIAAEGSAWKYILNCAPRRATLQDDPSSSLTQAIRYDNLIVGEPGKVYVDVLVRESDIYYERIWDDDGVLPPRWDWVESESELVYLYAGDYHTFEFWVYPTDTEEQFAFWLYQRDLLGGYQIIEKALIDEPLYALPAGTDLKKPEISDILFLNKTNSNIGIAFNEPILEYSINEQTIKIIGQNGLYNYNFQILGNGDEVLIDQFQIFNQVKL